MIRVDQTIRQPHYGPTRQPWDDIVDMGWGPGFAAGNVLKYLRRDKAADHSLESARWYWGQIVRRSNAELSLEGLWTVAGDALNALLTAEEQARLR